MPTALNSSHYFQKFDFLYNSVNGFEIEKEIQINIFKPFFSSSSSCNSDGKKSATLGCQFSLFLPLCLPLFTLSRIWKSSRLHFIGTGRNRCRMRFPNLSNGFKNARSDVNTAAVNEKVVINIDMDCFFVLVVVKDHRELLDNPVAVCHSDSSRGVKANKDLIPEACICSI